MRVTPTGRILRMVACALMLCISAGSLRAQSDEPSNDQLLRDFIHYVKIARYDAAELVGQELLSRDLPAEAFTDLLESSGELKRFRSAVGEAMRADTGGELEATAASLEKLFETGKLNRARSPEEIQRNIGLLTGQLQGRYLATQRLLTAGEYAVPFLFEALVDASNPELQAASQKILIDMGSQSVVPLCVALEHIEPSKQALVANVLGLKGYRTAIPYLAEVAQSTNDQVVATACTKAIDRLGGDGGMSLAGLFRDLGEIYYSERPEVTSFPGEAHQLLWSYMAPAPGNSLIPTPIRTEVYHEAMAMRMAEKSLGFDSRSLDAAALWVASNIKRKVEQPKDYENPAYGSDRPSPAYFAVAAGMPVDQRVLARGLDTRNTPLIRAAIAAIEKIAGGAQLWSGLAQRRPLVEALSYPNRRVQYEAALAFGAAAPHSSFEGAQRVVPLLAGAVRDIDKPHAIVLSNDVEKYQTMRQILQSAGYEVLPRAEKVGELEEAIAQVAGVDVVVTLLPVDATKASIEAVKYHPSLAATPVLALLEPQSAAAATPLYDRNPMVMIRRTGLPADKITNAVSQLVDQASGGPITAEEARAYSNRAVAVLRDLAVGNNEVLNVNDAVLPLVASLGDATGARQMDIAEVLAHINDERAQQALAGAALQADGATRVALLGKTADSAKRYGNLLEERQVDRVITVARSEDADQAFAAAALLGALGVPNSDFLPRLMGQ